jgi:hypothetical protein
MVRSRETLMVVLLFSFCLEEMFRCGAW